MGIRQILTWPFRMMQDIPKYNYALILTTIAGLLSTIYAIHWSIEFWSKRKSPKKLKRGSNLLYNITDHLQDFYSPFNSPEIVEIVNHLLKAMAPEIPDQNSTSLFVSQSPATIEQIHFDKPILFELPLFEAQQDYLIEQVEQARRHCHPLLSSILKRNSFIFL